MVNSEQDEEFERVWEAADWMFKNDKQDAKYFFLKGQQVETVKRQLELDKLKEEIDALYNQRRIS